MPKMTLAWVVIYFTLRHRVLHQPAVRHAWVPVRVLPQAGDSTGGAEPLPDLRWNFTIAARV